MCSRFIFSNTVTHATGPGFGESTYAKEWISFSELTPSKCTVHTQKPLREFLSRSIKTLYGPVATMVYVAPTLTIF
jgi:hypothetical protein